MFIFCSLSSTAGLLSEMFWECIQQLIPYYRFVAQTEPNQESSSILSTDGLHRRSVCCCYGRLSGWCWCCCSDHRCDQFAADVTDSVLVLSVDLSLADGFAGPTHCTDVDGCCKFTIDNDNY